MATETQIKTWRSELKRDFPKCDDFFLDLVLDLYKHNPEYVKKLSKKKFKEVTSDIPHEIVGAVDVIPSTDTDFMNKYFKEPLMLPAEEEATA